MKDVNRKMTTKTCVITGGFGFLGREVAKSARRAGYNIALVDIHAEPPTGDFSGKDQNILFLGGVDISNAKISQNAATKINEHFGRMDVLINIAGGFLWETVEAGAPDNWNHLHKINVMTCLNMTRACLPYIKENKTGRIINIGAAAALKSEAGMGAYAASKSAVHRLTESLAAELKEDNITVNAVLPSIIDTPLNRKDMPDENYSKWVAPSELANIILFLASEEASPITGALLPVTGRC